MGNGFLFDWDYFIDNLLRTEVAPGKVIWSKYFNHGFTVCFN